MQRVWVLPVLLAGALAAHAGDKAGPAVGSVPYDFNSRDSVTHEPIRLSAQAGKVVVLTFWATWCGPCRRELPVLENLQNTVAREQLVVYAVPFKEPPGTYAELVKLFRSWKLTLIDDRSGWIASHYGIHSIPHLFLIGRDGRIAAEHKGYGEGSVEALVADVNAALRAAPAATAEGATATPPAH